MKNIMLIYPPGEIYQRSEDRCQININASVANDLRACNDLGYIAAQLKGNFNIFLKDYPAENINFKQFLNDIETFKPDIIFISTTNGSIYNDLNIVNNIKSINKNIVIILKGAIFFNPERKIFNEIDLSQTDYLIGGESEFIVPKLINFHFNNPSEIENIEGICYKKNHSWVINELTKFNEALDELPFPDRNLIKNELYKNPATNKTMATISISKGCPSSCIYCISPVISGKKTRFRSSKSVFNEISECFEKFGISNFFFQSDTFTIDNSKVSELCDLIINSSLQGKINWVANSRVNTLSEKMLGKMKKAGCSLIALGLESGSDESLKLMKKGTNTEQNFNAIKLIKKYNLKIFGFYIIGFPWETKEHLKATKDFIFKADTDFIEISIATPFKGSELYSMIESKLTNKQTVLGKDSFKNTSFGTDFLTKKELEDFRKRLILQYHFRPKYILKKVFDRNITVKIFYNYVKFGIRLILNTIKGDKNNND